MNIALLGKKIGMTQVFDDANRMIPVTVIEAGPCPVTQVKATEKDGYDAIQIGFRQQKEHRLTKAALGHFKKAGVEPVAELSEFRTSGETDINLGDMLTVERFEAGQKVDVIGTSIGKGFAGVIKRYHFAMQDATHGNSLAHRAPGSIGQNQSPGRVFKGKKMSGHMGNVRRTAQNLEVVRVDSERNLLLIKGAVPGHKGSKVVVQPAVKSKNGAAS
jgi:large subunit ribosomal protein L3